MKILHVTKKYPNALGGDAVVVANLQKQQQTAGHAVVIITSNCDEIIAATVVHKVGFKDTPSGLDAITFKRIASLLALFFRAFGIIGKERPDVVHTHSVDMAFFVSFAARWYGVPVVHTFHIVTFYDANQSMLRRKSELWLAKKAKPQYVTAPNMYDVKKLRAAGLTQAVLLPNGVDITSWKPEKSCKENDTFTFLSVGRLEQQKGYEYLIKATSLLATTQPELDFKVVIVGDGSQKKALQELVHTLNVEHIITFAGSKNQAEVRTLLSAASAVVLPSLYETTPLTLLEAWAAAVPVIASPVGILRDAPADFNAAYMVSLKNERMLMETMTRCMTDEAQRTVVAARGHAEAKKYSWPIVTKTAEAMYRGAL